MTVKELAIQAATQLNLPPKYVWEIYKLYWLNIRLYMSQLDVKNTKNEECIAQIRSSINIPSLGKFYIDWDKIKNKRKENEKFKN